LRFALVRVATGVAAFGSEERAIVELDVKATRAGSRTFIIHCKILSCSSEPATITR